MTKQHHNCQNLCWHFHEESNSSEYAEKTCNTQERYENGQSVIDVIDELFCAVSARAYMAGSDWVHKLLVTMEILRGSLQLHSLWHTSDFYW